MTVEQNKFVSINYTLKDDEGNIVDTSINSSPLDYIHGNGYLLPKLEEQITGKNSGDKFNVDLCAADGYGEYNPALISEIPVEQFDTSVPIEVGMAFQAQTAAGVQIVRVTKVSEKTITVDANNEMAGKNLHFEIEILDVREPTEEELSASQGCCCGGGCGGGCSCDGGCGEDGCGGCGN